MLTEWKRRARRVPDPTELEASRMIMSAAIPHSGQLKSTSSILCTPSYPGVMLKSNLISVDVGAWSVRKCSAHKLPSSPEITGMSPSSRSLVQGVEQFDVTPPESAWKSEQWPVGEDPLTDNSSSELKVKLVGRTKKKSFT